MRNLGSLHMAQQIRAEESFIFLSAVISNVGYSQANNSEIIKVVKRKVEPVIYRCNTLYFMT